MKDLIHACRQARDADEIAAWSVAQRPELLHKLGNRSRAEGEQLVNLIAGKPGKTAPVDEALDSPTLF